MAVLAVVRAVNTAVDAVVGEVERGKHDNAVAIEFLFQLFCERVEFLNFLLIFAGEKNGGLTVS